MTHEDTIQVKKGGLVVEECVSGFSSVKHTVELFSDSVHLCHRLTFIKHNTSQSCSVCADART